jgi:glycosyltransferase involved in cell wall biosynthesis
MRLLFVARALHDMAGGVERMIISVMNEMVSRGHEVALFSWDREDAVAFYAIDPRVSWFKLASGDPSRRASLSERLLRVSKVRGMVKGFRPDVITCFQGGPFRAMLGYTWGLQVPLVAAERTAPTLYDHANNTRLRKLEHWTFQFATRITVQFDRYRDYYPRKLQDLIVETPNPVPEATVQAHPDVPSLEGRYTLLSVGRLSYQKNYSALVQAFAKIAPQFPLWDLKIVGEGEDRSALEDALRNSSLDPHRVVMPGKTDRISEAYAAANLFCLPSRWEGFPNALAEALAHGLPSVGFEGCAGVPDLITPGVTGRLAPGNGSADALSDALASLMSNDALRQQMGRNAVLAMKRYRPELCFDRWEAVLREVAGQ